MGLVKHKDQFSNDSFQYVIEIDFQLDAFYDYIKLTENIINNEVVEIIKKYKKQDELDGPDDISYDYQDFEIRQNISIIYYNSIFVTLFSFLERKLYQLCKIGENNQLIKVKDLSGEGVQKYYKYIKKVLLINLDSLNTEWSEIKKYNYLRNRIIHNPTNEIDINEENSSIIITLKSIDKLTHIEDNNIFTFTIDNISLLHNFLSTIRSFFGKLYYEEKSSLSKTENNNETKY